MKAKCENLMHKRRKVATDVGIACRHEGVNGQASYFPSCDSVMTSSWVKRLPLRQKGTVDREAGAIPKRFPSSSLARKHPRKRCRGLPQGDGGEALGK